MNICPKIFVCTGIFLLIVYTLHAQQASVRGQVTDGEEPLPFVSVILLKNTEEKPVQYTLTDSLGYYTFKNLAFGRYLLKGSYLGYRDFTSDTIHLDAGQAFFEKNVSLEPDSQQLDGVIIQAKRRLLETDKGKLVFNVQNSATTSGQTALDMLKKLPGVSVGQNDEILFRGGAGVNVMVDGKMTYLSGNQLANYLKGMSAEDINKIELITTPSVEFDAAGNAGIINIVPKQNLKKGYAVDLRTSVSKGKYWMTNENVSASLRTKKLNLFGSLDFSTPYSFSQNQSGNTISDNGNQLDLQRKNESSYKTNFYTWKIGGDWQFLPKHRIAFSYHGYFDDFTSENISRVNRLSKTAGLQSYMQSRNNITEPYHYDAASMHYLFKIDTLGKKITADVNHTSYRNFSDGLMTTRHYSPEEDFLFEDQLKSHQPGFVKIISVKADVDLPFKEFSLKTGLKYAEVQNDNQYRFDSLQAGNFVEIEDMSNHFKYKERIAAAYLSGSRAFGKTNVEAGLRMEYTHADGYTVKQDVANKWKYTKLFPSLAVEQIISDDHKVDFSLSRRINRPSYTELNPVRWYTDQYLYFSGNPELVPELAWVYALTYSLKNKYIFSASYNRGINYISRKLSMDENGVTKTQSANFGNRQRWDFTASAPFRPLPFWDLQFFSDINYTSYPISQLDGERKLSLWSVTATLQQDFMLPKDFTLNLAAYFFSPELRGIYKTESTGFINFGIKKSFFEKQLTTQFSVSDLFNTNRYKATSQTDITNYYYNDKPYSRVFGLSLTWHFGGELIKTENRKTEEQERL